MYALYSAGLLVALVAYLPVFAWRKLRRGDYRRGLGERLGRFEPGLPRAPRCWIHAVSVGEAAAAAPLVEAIARRWPELSIVVTTVTPTGARIVADRLGGVATHRYFPVDLPGAGGASARRRAAALLRRARDRALAELPARAGWTRRPLDDRQRSRLRPLVPPLPRGPRAGRADAAGGVGVRDAVRGGRAADHRAGRAAGARGRHREPQGRRPRGPPAPIRSGGSGSRSAPARSCGSPAAPMPGRRRSFSTPTASSSRRRRRFACSWPRATRSGPRRWKGS